MFKIVEYEAQYEKFYALYKYNEDLRKANRINEEE
jgi:hypothetical protein